MRVHIPILLGFCAGMFFLVQFFMPHQAIRATYEELIVWLRIIFLFSVILGITSLLQRHWNRLRTRGHDWQYSIITLVSFVVVCVLGIGWGKTPGTSFDWVFNNIFVPLDATMFSLLAFFVASAAYRTFRARTPEATLLLVAALIVMMGRVPLGEMIHAQFPVVTEWIMSVPAVAGKRAIMFGVALGAIATSLRIMLGLERQHLGG